VGLHSYESAYKRYPPGAIWSSSPNIRRGSILVHLLPFIEHGETYDLFDFTQTNVDNTVFSGTTNRVAETRLETYICPSDDQSMFYWNNAPHNYAASRGPTEVYDNPSCSCSHPWQPLALAPLDDPRRFAGPFTRVGTTIRVNEVLDGLSNTIFFGEVRPACSEHVRNGWVHSNNGNGYCTTLIPINYDTCHETAASPCNQYCNWNTEVGFKSLHPGGAQFLLGDGSVRFMKAEIAHQTVYQYLGGKSDGQVVSAF
jgi:prepilin-type processing-associated H-X9-DG protein